MYNNILRHHNSPKDRLRELDSELLQFEWSNSDASAAIESSNNYYQTGGMHELILHYINSLRAHTRVM